MRLCERSNRRRLVDVRTAPGGVRSTRVPWISNLRAEQGGGHAVTLIEDLVV